MRLRIGAVVSLLAVTYSAFAADPKARKQIETPMSIAKQVGSLRAMDLLKGARKPAVGR